MVLPARAGTTDGDAWQQLAAFPPPTVDDYPRLYVRTWWSPRLPRRPATTPPPLATVAAGPVEEHTDNRERERAWWGPCVCVETTGPRNRHGQDTTHCGREPRRVCWRVWWFFFLWKVGVTGTGPLRFWAAVSSVRLGNYTRLSGPVKISHWFSACWEVMLFGRKLAKNLVLEIKN